MWLGTKIRDATASVVLFGWSNLCLWNNIAIPGSEKDNDPNQDNSWRVSSKEDMQKYFEQSEFNSIQSEDTLRWETTPLGTLKNETKEKVIVCLKTDDENSFTYTSVLESIDDPQNVILEYPLDQLFQKYWKDKKPHPLYVWWVAKNFRALLWRWGIEASDLPQKLNQREKEITSETRYEIWDTLRFHLIEPSLLDKFPENLKDQLAESWFETFSDKDSLEVDIKSNESIQWKRYREDSTEFGYFWNPNKEDERAPIYTDIVVKSLPWWKSALAVYRDWKLFMATYASVWTPGRQTRKWQYEIIGKNAYKRSAKYDNSPMPFALNYSWWYYLHQWNVSWYPLSHWCVRLPWVYANVLYSLVKDKEHVDVFIDKNLYKSK